MATKFTFYSGSKKAVRRAGQVLKDTSSSDDARIEALELANTWRSAQAYPMNTLQVRLRSYVNALPEGGLVAQRLKRMPSVEAKLQREPRMQLDTMQDLGGCRAVLRSIARVEEVRQLFLNSQHRHELGADTSYIATPKASGYRGIHLIYSYHSEKVQEWNGLRTEIQLRTQLQHTWATAVETIGLFTTQALKSSQGSAEWLKFFQLMSLEIAVREDAPLIPNTPTDASERRKEIRRLARKLQVVKRLEGFTQVVQQLSGSRRNARFFLLDLDVSRFELTATGYDNQGLAAAAYGDLERETREIPSRDVVLVSVQNMDALRSAYPNYFADVTAFTELVESS